jgi:hypothetical protein
VYQCYWIHLIRRFFLNYLFICNGTGMRCSIYECFVWFHVSPFSIWKKLDPSKFDKYTYCFLFLVQYLILIVYRFCWTIFNTCKPFPEEYEPYSNSLRRLPLNEKILNRRKTNKYYFQQHTRNNSTKNEFDTYSYSSKYFKTSLKSHTNENDWTLSTVLNFKITVT